VVFTPRPAARESLRLVVYEQDGCDYCRVLREDLLPSVLAQLPARIAVDYQPADRHPWVERTPTLVIDDPRGPEVLEGLPSRRYLERRLRMLLSPSR